MLNSLKNNSNAHLYQTPFNEEHKNIKSEFDDRNDFPEKILCDNSLKLNSGTNIKSEFCDKTIASSTSNIVHDNEEQIDIKIKYLSGNFGILS